MSPSLIPGKEYIDREVTKAIRAWEGDKEFKDHRFWHHDKGFGVFQENFPQSLQSKPDLKHHLVKLKIDGVFRYGLYVDTGSQNKAGSSGSFQLIQLLEKDERGDYALSENYYGLKMFHSSTLGGGVECDQENLKKINKLINFWKWDERYKECTMFSKRDGFGTEEGGGGFNLSHSLVRFKYGMQYLYGLRRKEDEGKPYEVVDLLYHANGNYILSDAQYGIQISGKSFHAVNDIPTTPTAAQLAEAKILEVLGEGGDVFAAHGTTFLAMKYFPGYSLGEYKRNVFPRLSFRKQMEASLDLIGQGQKALDYLQTKKIIHRDLKPDNIIYDPDSPKEPQVNFVDAGLSRKAEVSGEFVNEIIDSPVGTTGYFPTYSASVANAGKASEEVAYNKKTDCESLARTFYSVLDKMENCYFKLRAQILLMLDLIFSEGAQINLLSSIYTELNFVKNKLDLILEKKARARVGYDNVFLGCFSELCKDSSVSVLFDMASTEYERTKRSSSGKFVATYTEDELAKIKLAREQLLPIFLNVCQQTALMLLRNYGSLWVMIFELHWGRNNRGLVNDYLERHPTASLNEIVEWANKNVLGQESINQEGCLARCCLFIYSMNPPVKVESNPQAFRLHN